MKNFRLILSVALTFTGAYAAVRAYQALTYGQPLEAVLVFGLTIGCAFAARALYLRSLQ